MRKYSKYLLLFFPLAGALASVWAIHRHYPRNYGLAFNEDIYYCAICAAISAYLYIKQRERFFLFAVILNILAALYFFSLDKFNIMIDYDTWAERGMARRFSGEPLTVHRTDEESERLREIIENSNRIEQENKAKEND